MTDPQTDRELIAEAKGMYPPWDDGLTVAVFRILADRLEVLTDQLEKVEALLPGPRTLAELLSQDGRGNLWPRTIDADEVAAILTEKEA